MSIDNTIITKLLDAPLDTEVQPKLYKLKNMIYPLSQSEKSFGELEAERELPPTGMSLFSSICERVANRLQKYVEAGDARIAELNRKYMEERRDRETRRELEELRREFKGINHGSYEGGYLFG